MLLMVKLLEKKIPGIKLDFIINRFNTYGWNWPVAQMVEWWPREAGVQGYNHNYCYYTY